VQDDRSNKSCCITPGLEILSNPAVYHCGDKWRFFVRLGGEGPRSRLSLHIAKRIDRSIRKCLSDLTLPPIWICENMKLRCSKLRKTGHAGKAQKGTIYCYPNRSRAGNLNYSNTKAYSLSRCLSTREQYSVACH
jgi:hypothetical protein